MKSRFDLAIPLLAAIVAAGCASPAPIAQNFPASHQRVARTAGHWDVVAEDVVTQTMQSIGDREDLRGRGLHVAQARRSTAFDTAFREFMITHLVARGANVSLCKVGRDTGPGFSTEGPDVEIQYDTQVIGHGDYLPEYQPGRLTALAAGVAVVRNVVLAGHETTGAIGGLAMAEWGAGHLAWPTRTEIIVTTTIIERNRFAARRSDVYYVPDADAKLFVKRVARRSTCPDDERLDSPERLSAAEIDVARQESFEREMLRINPRWRPAHRGIYSQ